MISESAFKLAFLSYCVLLNLNLYAQSDTCDYYIDTELNDTIYTQASSPAFYGNSEADLFHYLAENIEIKRDQIESYYEKIFISVIVDKSGAILDADIIRGGNEEINTIILEKVNQMEEWAPALCNKRTVNYKMTFPISIHFKK